MRLVALATALVLALLSPTPAHAAELGLNDVLRPFETVAQRCDDAVATSTSGSPATTVTVSGIDAACAGRQLSVVVFSSSGAQTSASGTVPAGGGSVTVDVRRFVPTAGHDTFVMIGGWPIPSTWGYSPPVLDLPAVSCRVPSNPSIGCTATLGQRHQWSSSPGVPVTHWQQFVSVSTSHPSPVEWEITFNLSDPEFPVVPRTFQDLQGGLVLVSASTCDANPRTVTVRGTTAWGDYHRVSSGTTQSLQVEGSILGGVGNLLTCP